MNGMYKSNRMRAEPHLFEMNQPSQSERRRTRDEDFDGRSESNDLKGASDNDQDINQPLPKKRHTQDQIQVMEDFFKECQLPNDGQRKELSRQLGLEPLQVKYWFQNKRTQVKAKCERHEISNLRAENEKLRLENLAYKEAFSNTSCPNFAGPLLARRDVL
ncbi:homeobox-leucine zipper protein ROC2-like [Tasmannia lanceolata]|uniref:homeobox-leucine zipper protein ROC2-like n=1 Tax=Tasmannia lanceolata TaxID=3420 RepID=UPI0040628342